jgi:NTE family protein
MQDDGERVFVLDQEFLAETRIGRLDVDFGRALGQWGEIRLGGYHGRAEAEVRLPIREEQKETLGGYQLRFSVDRLDKAFFPRHGIWLILDSRVSRDAMGADREYDRAEFLLNKPLTAGDNTFIGRLKLGSDFDSDVPFYDDFQLGGFLNLSGYRRNELQGQSLGYIALVYFRRLNQSKGPFGMNFYAGASIEAGNTWLDSEAKTFDSLLPAGSIFLGADTVFGPIYLAFAKAEGSGSTAYLQLGRIF